MRAYVVPALVFGQFADPEYYIRGLLKTRPFDTYFFDVLAFYICKYGPGRVIFFLIQTHVRGNDSAINTNHSFRLGIRRV